jgi:hypothetical protein
MSAITMDCTFYDVWFSNLHAVACWLNEMTPARTVVITAEGEDDDGILNLLALYAAVRKRAELMQTRERFEYACCVRPRSRPHACTAISAQIAVAHRRQSASFQERAVSAISYQPCLSRGVAHRCRKSRRALADGAFRNNLHARRAGRVPDDRRADG